MKLETRTLYAAFWDDDLRGGYCALILGWREEGYALRPVVAHDGGTKTLYFGQWHVYTSEREAGTAAANMSTPEEHSNG